MTHLTNRNYFLIHILGAVHNPVSFAPLMANGLTEPVTLVSSEPALCPPLLPERTPPNHSDFEGGPSNTGTRRSVQVGTAFSATTVVIVPALASNIICCASNGVFAVVMTALNSVFYQHDHQFANCSAIFSLLLLHTDPPWLATTATLSLPSPLHPAFSIRAPSPQTVTFPPPLYQSPPLPLTFCQDYP